VVHYLQLCELLPGYTAATAAGCCFTPCWAAPGRRQALSPLRCPHLTSPPLAIVALQDQPRMYGALLLLRIIARKYEFKDDVSSSSSSSSD
jgi:hypothetical protein